MTVNPPKISVIMAMRNAASTIGRALDSLVLQHYPNLEIIVRDAVSTDGTLEILARYKDMITILISEPDKGVADAYNRALEVATGEFVGYLNADDEFEPGMLWAVADAITANPDADVITTGIICRMKNAKGQHVVTGYYAAKDQLALTLENALSDLPTYMLSRFIRRTFSLKVGPYNTDRSLWFLACDREWMARLALMPSKHVSIDQALYGFEVHEAGISSNPQSYIRIIEEHVMIAAYLLTRSDLSETQRATVRHWQKQQFALGFIRSLRLGQWKKAKTFWHNAINADGLSFIPWSAGLFGKRLITLMALSISGGIDQGK